VIVSLLATLAKQEAIRLSERTIAGLERARAQGRIGGRPRLSCDISKALKLHASGRSLAKISNELKISKTSVHRIVTRSSREAS
jgi:DNA invertase Pin-like site-specific DNA recombinase